MKRSSFKEKGKDEGAKADITAEAPNTKETDQEAKARRGTLARKEVAFIFWATAARAIALR